jgi:hypothetical protein
MWGRGLRGELEPAARVAERRRLAGFANRDRLYSFRSVDEKRSNGVSLHFRKEGSQTRDDLFRLLTLPNQAFAFPGGL